MSTTVSSMSPATATPPRWRTVLGALAPVGPLAMAGWSLSIPYALADPPEVWIPLLGTADGRVQLSFWMMLLFALTIGIGVIVTGLVARSGSRRLGTAGLVTAYLGFTAMGFGGIAFDAIAGSAVKAGLDVATVERILAQADTYQAPTVGGMVFIPLSFVGVLLLGIALWRGRLVPRWAAVLLFIAFPVILLGGAVFQPLNAAGFVLVGIAFGMAGRAFARGVPLH